MESLSCPKSLFLEIEPFIKEYYGVDRNNIDKILDSSIDPKVFINKEIQKGKSIIVKSPDTILENIDTLYIKIYDNCQYEKVETLCEEYGIKPNTFEYNVLIFMSLVPDVNYGYISTQLEELEQSFWEYEIGVRPEMLNLYIALHNGKTKYRKNTRIAFGNGKTIKIDQMYPWLQMALDKYLDKYLGVKDVEEAEKELLTIYGKNVGAKLNKTEVSYIWGTYHLLQRITKFKSKTKRRANVLQSKFIFEYITILGLHSNDDLNFDFNILRSRLNYFLKTYDTLEELIPNTYYKTSPNNKGGMTYF